MIGSAIEAQAEAYDLAEAYGLDRGACHEFFSQSIFDCLIYRGYGHRVAHHDHAPYENAHFSLELGHKDMLLAKDAAAEKSTASTAGECLSFPMVVDCRQHP